MSYEHKAIHTKKNGLVLKALTRYLTTTILVRLAGIEPTTPWFVAKYSIQLSYSREKRNYSMCLIIYGSPTSCANDGAYEYASEVPYSLLVNPE